MIKILIFRHIGYQWFAIGLQGLIAFALGILVARCFGPEMFGVYSVALSIGMLLGIFIDGGFGYLLQREAASATPGIGFDANNLSGYAFGQALLVIGGMSIFVLVAPIPFHRPTLLAVVFAFGVAVIGNFFMATLRGQGRLARDALWQLINRGLTALCVLVVLWWGANQPWQIFAAQSFGGAVFVLYLVRLQRVTPILPVPLNVYTTMLPMLWFNLVSVIYSRADMVLLKLLGTPRPDIGHYGVAYRIMELVLLLAAPIGLLLFRHFRLNESGVELTLKRVLWAAALAGLIGCGVFGMSAVFGDVVIVIAFGEPFAPASTLLMVLAVSLVSALANRVLFQAAMAFGMERYCAIVATVAAFVNISANFLLIPKYGVLAAAWITVATETIVGLFLLYELFLKRRNWETQRVQKLG